MIYIDFATFSSAFFSLKDTLVTHVTRTLICLHTER